MKSIIEHKIDPINVFMFSKKCNNMIICCNLRILRNCKRVYSFYFYDDHGLIIANFEMNEKFTMFIIKFSDGSEIICSDKKRFDERITHYINVKTIDINNKNVLIWIKDNYLLCNDYFPFRFGF